METAASGIGARAVALFALVAAALALPAVGIDASVAHAASASDARTHRRTPRSPTTRSKSSISIHSDDDGDDSTIISMCDDNHSFTANIHGKLMLNDDETEIIGLSEGGTAKLERNRRRREAAHRTHRARRQTRTALLRRQHRTCVRRQGARLHDDRRHRHGAQRHRCGRTRETSVCARRRQARARRDRETAFGLRERHLSAHAARHGQAVAGRSGSRHRDRRQFQFGLRTPPDADAFFEKQPFDAPHQVDLSCIRSEKFNSDYDRAETLVDVVPHLDDSQPVRQAWLDAARGLHSDYDRRRTYEAMLAHNGMDDRTDRHGDRSERVDAFGLRSRRASEARGETRARRRGDRGNDYAKSAEGISSDYTRREALTALMEADHFGPRAANAVLDAADDTFIRPTTERNC